MPPSDVEAPGTAPDRAPDAALNKTTASPRWGRWLLKLSVAALLALLWVALVGGPVA